MIYLSKEGETLDYICWRYYGKTYGVFEKVLNANPHLWEEDVILQANVEITLPDIEESSEDSSRIKLWQ